jgi:hypothetical protein
MEREITRVEELSFVVLDLLLLCHGWNHLALTRLSPLTHLSVS